MAVPENTPAKLMTLRRSVKLTLRRARLSRAHAPPRTQPARRCDDRTAATLVWGRRRIRQAVRCRRKQPSRPTRAPTARRRFAARRVPLILRNRNDSDYASVEHVERGGARQKKVLDRRCLEGANVRGADHEVCAWPPPGDAGWANRLCFAHQLGLARLHKDGTNFACRVQSGVSPGQNAPAYYATAIRLHRRHTNA